MADRIHDTKKFKALLDEQHEWPCDFLFKFIVPTEKTNEVRGLFDPSKVRRVDTRPSKNGKYTSVTAQVNAESSDEVLDIYIRASRIEGIISL